MTRLDLHQGLHNKQLYHLSGDINKTLPFVVGGKKSYLNLKDGRKVFDASCGAAVASLGYGNKRVIKAVTRQLKTGTPYISSAYWSNEPAYQLSEKLILSTNGALTKVYFTGSGSEAMEASLKLARQYFYIQDKNTPRVNFISRDRSYHGNTLGALSVSGHKARRLPYVPILMSNTHFISPCYPYRQLEINETTEQFVSRKAKELENKFQELGPNTVIAFIAEPVVGAALGCVSFVPGYLLAMQEVCRRHGALLILDEVMCGMGRTGSLHAWQKEEGLRPDIQTLGKGLGAGYQPIAAVMASQRIVDVIESSQFIHGHTYDSTPVQARAALEVLSIIQEKDLINQVRDKGIYLGKGLKAALSLHPNVGDVRGIGLFWAIEFVEDKISKKPFDSQVGIASKIKDLALSPQYNMAVYPGTGTSDGINGDHIILAPSFLVTKKEIDFIIKTLSGVINNVFDL